MSYIIVISFFLSFCLTFLVMPQILIISHKKFLFDQPDLRKIHTKPVPRLGGFSFFPVILAVFGLMAGFRFIFLGEPIAVWELGQFVYLFVGLALLFLMGIGDDLIGIDFRKKFIVQIIAACLFPLSGLWINSLGGLFGIDIIPAYVGIPLTIFVVVYIINAINLIDGIDGLASGLSCISLVILGVMNFMYGHWLHLLLSAVTVGVLLPFFYFNVMGSAKNSKKLFMGDTGSLTLGYILSFQVLHFCQNTCFFNPTENDLQTVAFSTLIIPLFDVVRVVCSRIRDGRHVFKPDMNHIHHKFLRTGLSPTWAMIGLLLATLLFVGLNVFLKRYIPITFLFLIDVSLWICMHFVLNHFIFRREGITGKVWERSYYPYEK